MISFYDCSISLVQNSTDLQSNGSLLYSKKSLRAKKWNRQKEEGFFWNLFAKMRLAQLSLEPLLFIHGHANQKWPKGGKICYRLLFYCSKMCVSLKT